jgi:NAD(P)-dependent dehydrogenase (short-subunit alcohol dehydrogenase family)
VSKVWFITGASKGFGREWAQAALERGDKVAATARKPETLDALVDKYGDGVLSLKLDVIDRAADQAASPGDPTATREPILKVVDADEPPLRIFFGKAPLGIATKDYESRLANWNAWHPVSLQAQGA